ncbi:MAG: hypothetical protein G3M70_02470 [Candidatus Nitronauta litoralis]|uniref:histidine kinase n=1 Tax=Candidatus Nitronauta litoralis TaxID=2705533 RepID=A0A7T0BZ97_9BACT|nr:MAG: hypothetical protein G3M70_02470 [Candidatus Nitronauta litoralis]
MEIEDTEIGIQKNRIPTIFDAPGQNFDETELNREAAGLGLPTTKCLTNMLGGTIQVTSKFGKGSTFSVEFPTGEGESATS